MTVPFGTSSPRGATLMTELDNVVPLESPSPERRGGTGGGNDGRHGERLASIEAHMKHMATKAWVLGGVVGGMVAAVLITLAFIKLFAP